MKILVLNCGSSSIKYQLFSMTDEKVLAKGVVEKVGLKGSFIKHTKENGDKVMFEGDVIDHQSGIEYVFGILTSAKHGCLKNLDELDGVGHRMVHGGEKFNESKFIDTEVMEAIEKCIDLAPLHNPANIKGIEAVKSLIEEIPQVVVFDTAFHQTMPAHAYMYAIPYSLYQKHGIRRYGFHGTSHKYVSNKACEILGKKIEDLNIITCHLGNGGSMTAIKKGKSVDTTMGLTPVEGLMMGTRSGDVDLGIVTYIMDKEEIGRNEVTNVFNKQSGLLGISGVSSDMREVKAAAEKNNERAILALEMYHYRIKKYIGSYAAALGGVDLIIFTGGIGENNSITRETCLEGLEFFGINLDKEVNNNTFGIDKVITTPDSKVTVMVVPTDEELVIARDTKSILSSM